MVILSYKSTILQYNTLIENLSKLIFHRAFQNKRQLQHNSLTCAEFEIEQLFSLKLRDVFRFCSILFEFSDDVT